MDTRVRGMLGPAMLAAPRPIRPLPPEASIRSAALGDDDLVRRLAKGDEQAFREFFRTYSPFAKALALRIVSSPGLAEDVVQEVFLSVWQHAADYRGELGSVRAWLFAAVHNRAVDAVRREEAFRRRAQDEVAVLIPEAEDVAEIVTETQELAERRQRILAALEQLPAEQRAVVERMYFEGRTQATIAHETGLPLGTVKSRSLLAMRRLRKELEVDR
jgi:RNA polymerase sigma-70 factor, ECF subfamily